jgi:glutamyl-tRNA synthetase
LSLRPKTPLKPQDIYLHPEAALRFWVPEGIVTFTDLLQGPQNQNVLQEVGDFVLRRRDGLFAYQLAVVADDIAQGITHVVRGADLLFSTARQLQLWQALGHAPPHFAHVGLVVNAQDEKLSKRDGAVTLASLRAKGLAPEYLVQHLAASLGLPKDAPCTAAELAQNFTLKPEAARPWPMPVL